MPNHHAPVLDDNENAADPSSGRPYKRVLVALCHFVLPHVPLADTAAPLSVDGQQALMACSEQILIALYVLRARRRLLGVPFEVRINAPIRLLNVCYGLNDNLFSVLISCIKADLQLFFPFGKHSFQYYA
jgi:hypothetical protein